MEITGLTYSVSHYEHYEKHGDKNYFEEIIDKMILEGISGMNDSFREAIKALPKDKKRMTILSLLDKDLNLFKRIKALSDKEINRMDHIKDVILMLREYVKVGEVEKKKFGEVMTPLELVKEMLATLPEEVWSNPNLKWLDPANGTGPYPTMVIYKLMNGLRNVEGFEDDEVRYKHIVENMIYVCELQPKNMFLYLCAIDPFDTYKLNVYTGSFLDEGFDYHMKNVWGLDKVDIVMGNPPYNQNGTATGNTIWQLFLEKSYKFCRKNISFIHPSSWRMPLSSGDRLFKSSIIIKNHSKYIRILKKEESKKYFGLSIKVDYYLLDISKISNTCLIETDSNKIERNIKIDPFIPSYNFDLFDRILSEEENCKVIYSSKYDPRNEYVSHIESDKYIYKLIHTTPKKGNRYAFSSRNDLGHFGIQKVIFGDSGINDVIIDINGDYGMTQHSIGLEISSLEEGEILKKALMSNKFNKFLDSVMWGNFGIDRRLFSYLKKDFWREFI